MPPPSSYIYYFLTWKFQISIFLNLERFLIFLISRKSDQLSWFFWYKTGINFIKISWWFNYQKFNFLIPKLKSASTWAKIWQFVNVFSKTSKIYIVFIKLLENLHSLQLPNKCNISRLRFGEKSLTFFASSKTVHCQLGIVPFWPSFLLLINCWK